MKTVDPQEELNPDESSVARYLEQCPDFFVRHSELLETLSIPHHLGKKVRSLLEYQARLLQQRVQKLQQQQDSMQQDESQHRCLIQDLPRLIAELFDCATNFEILQVLEHFLRTDHDADWLRIFCTPNSDYNPEKLRDLVYPLNPDLRGMFTLIFNNPKPLCGSLQHEHIAALFGSNVDEIHSTLLIPFEFENNEALLAIASKKWQGYTQSVKLDLLVSIVEIVSGMTNSDG